MNQQTPINSLEDVNAVLLNIAALTLSVNKKETKMNELILDLKKDFEPDIKQLKEKIVLYEEQLQLFGKKNKKLFNIKRSADVTYGRVGFRAGKKALRLIKPKDFSWEYVREKLQDLFGAKFIKVKSSIKKTEVLNAFDKGTINEETLDSIGVKVTQGEEFFYKINWDTIKIENLDK